MGRYSSYRFATLYAIPLKDLEETIKRDMWDKSFADFNPDDLRVYYPEEVYDMFRTDTHIVFHLKNTFNGTDIYSLLKDFSMISPHKRQLSPEIAEEIGQIIEDKPLYEVMQLAKKGKYECFQTIILPDYLYCTPVPVGDKRVYVRTMVKGILMAYSYSKTDTEDETEPYEFLTSLIRYRLKENKLSPTLLAYLSV